MSKEIYGYAEVLETAKSVVEKYGHDYKYPYDNCVYAVYDRLDGQPMPACIVGKIIHKLDIEEFYTLAEYEEMVLNGDSISIVRIMEKDNTGMEIGFTSQALEFLQIIQDAQDNGVSWGEALRVAEKVI